jgi:hypothetical protein
VTVSHTDPELLALIALGEQDPAAAGHLAGCPQCQAEVSRLAAVVTVARSEGRPAGLTPPPPYLWNRIAAAAGTDPELSPLRGTAGASDRTAGSGMTAGRPGQPDPGPWPADGGRTAGGPALHGQQRPWWRRHPLAAGITAAAAGLIIGAGATAGFSQLGGPAPAHVVARIALRPLAEFPQWKDASGSAIMDSGPAGRELRVVLNAPRRPGFYEVWLLARNGVSMISLGDLGPGHSGRFAMPPGVNLANYSRIDISLQPFNGSTLHSKVSVVRGSLP